MNSNWWVNAGKVAQKWQARNKKKEENNRREQQGGGKRAGGEVGEESFALTYHCAEALIVQGLAAIFFLTFLGARYQYLGLVGDHGLEPARINFWEPLQTRYASSWQGFLQTPSIFWWIPMSDAALTAVIHAGLCLSALVLLTGQSTWLWQALLWMLYFSLVSTATATSFYSYGWESQLLETTFLSIFLHPLPGIYNDGRIFLGIWPSRTLIHVPSSVPRWLFRWLMFRITLGAGLIKTRGSSCWTYKTCLYYHFETQPIPSPLSFVFHFLPRAIQRHLITVDFIAQLYTCWFVLAPPVGRLGRWSLGTGDCLLVKKTC